APCAVASGPAGGAGGVTARRITHCYDIPQNSAESLQEAIPSGFHWKKFFHWKCEQIDAIEVDLNDIDRRRWEIAENLHRSELTVLQRDEHVAEWIRLTDEAESIPSQVATVSKPKCVHRPMTDGIPDGWRTAFRWHGGQCSGMMPDSSG